MEFVKFVVVVNYFCKTLHFNSLAELSIWLNLGKFVLSFKYALVYLGSEYTGIRMNITKYAKYGKWFWICLNITEYSWISINIRE